MSILTDWELWACANECIRQYGFDATIHAAMRADEMEGGLALDSEEGVRNGGDGGPIIVAGRPGELETALREAGVDEFIFAGADVIDVLTRALEAA